MLKPIIGTVGLALVGLFGYYYFTDAGGTQGERAEKAGMRVLDTAKDTTAGGVIKTRLTAALGLDAARLVHVWYDDGHVIVYGLAPESVTADGIRSLVKDIPGVKEIEVLIQARPALTPGGTTTEAPPAAKP